MYAPEHWSGSCRTCRTGCYGPDSVGHHRQQTLVIVVPVTPVGQLNAMCHSQHLTQRTET